ncbi:MAG: hypothetical protein OEY67_08180 [Gammaproteobacteria bacterium]|nr:hypothetical protein [Gammaproteobacteria bacterium]
MDLPLSLPQLSKGELDPKLSDPSKVKAWLDELPMLNVEESSHEIHKSLIAINRTPLEETTRIKLLELYRAPIKVLTDKLLKSYGTLPLPLSDKYQIAADRVRHFQNEMAYGYKWIVRDMYHRIQSKLLGRHSTSLALPIQRAIYYLTGSLVHSYQQYAPYQAGTWKELHILYQLAELNGITEMPVEDPINDVLGHSSVSHVYKQALLVDLSDPYHLPAQMITKIYRYLDVMASLAHVHRPPIIAVADNCQFLVDLNSDRAGHMVMGQPDELQSKHLRLLNTVDLARTIHGQLTQLEEGKAPDSQGLGDGFFDAMAQNMCRRLINSWGVNPKRVFKRVPKSDISVNTAIGLESAVYVFNQSRKFITSAEYMGPKPQRTRIGTFFTRPDPALLDDVHLEEETQNDTEYALSTWDMVDESAGGMALAKTGYKGPIRVGEIIATHNKGGSESWSLSVIRWMRRLDNQHTELGIQRLAPSAKPLAIKTLVQQNKESEFMPGLLLPEIPALKQAQSLITPRGVFRNDGIVYIDDGNMMRRVTCTKLMEVTGSYERFQFRFQEF